MMKIIRQTSQGVSFYACDGFSQIPHGFSTRQGGVSPAPWDSLNLSSYRGDLPDNVAENFRRFCGAVGADWERLEKNHQVHGNLLRIVRQPEEKKFPEVPGAAPADGLITDQPGVCLAVFSADCIPVLLYDPQRPCIAAVHAGWRGTAQAIVRNAVEQMVQLYHCRPQDILAAIGPGISPCCFQTHDDVPQALELALGEKVRPLIRPLSQEGKFSVDLKGANRQLLLDAGLLPEHIAVSDACTACNPREFWSHRTMGSRRGSMAAIIQLPK